MMGDREGQVSMGHCFSCGGVVPFCQCCSGAIVPATSHLCTLSLSECCSHCTTAAFSCMVPPSLLSGLPS